MVLILLRIYLNVSYSGIFSNWDELLVIFMKIYPYKTFCGEIF